MIAKVFCTRRDKYLLERTNKRGIASGDAPVDFSKLVVMKPWGYEYVTFQSSDVAIWRVFIKFGEATSLHCHPSKQTAMIVLTGQAKCHTLDKEMVLHPFDALIIETGAFHSTEALSPEGTNIIEVDSPPLLTDLVRLEDKYGRTGKPYEGKDKMELKEREEQQGYSLSIEPTNLKNLQPCDIVAVLDEIPVENGTLRPGDILYVKDFLPLTPVYKLLVIRR